jgi:hypothetical protein
LRPSSEELLVFSRFSFAVASGLFAIIMVSRPPVADAQVMPVAGHAVTSTGSVPITAYLIERPQSREQKRLEFWEEANGKVISAYDVDMTKLMHMIVVSDDLTSFQHIHPALEPNGHFTIDVNLPEVAGGYHVYVDGMPHSFGRQVFRFDLSGENSAVTRLVHETDGTVRVGPYTLEYSPMVVPAGQISDIAVTITRDGRPATDLHPYLGVMAHGVFIGTDDLAYMHVHGMTSEMLAMASSASDCGDSMMMQMSPMPPMLTIGNRFELEVLPPRDESYDGWLQFIGGSTLYTAPLLLTTR